MTDTTNTAATTETVEAPKYPNLGKTFLRGKFPGQLDSAYKDRETNPAKAKDFVAALQAGDVTFPTEGVTQGQADKLKALGLEVEAQYVQAAKQRGRKAEAKPEGEKKGKRVTASKKAAAKTEGEAAAIPNGDGAPAEAKPKRSRAKKADADKAGA
jgi:hypothetical protein